MKEDQQHQDWCNIPKTEQPYTEPERFEIGMFASSFPIVPCEYNNQQATERQEDVGGCEVNKVKEGFIPHL